MRSKKALLVYPEVPKNTYWSFSHTLKFINKKSAMPPLGLITVAALFPDGYDLKLVDMNVERLTEGHLRWADTVFISAMIVQKESFEKVVALCNRHGTPVVAGGPYATSCYPDITGVDHFVLGEAEPVFADFLSDYARGRAEKVYRCSKRPDLSQSVLPRFDLLKLKSYANMCVQYSRGCPFKCEFCDIWPVYGNKARVKPAEMTIAELQTLYDHGWRGPIFIVDDNFIGNQRKVKSQLLPALMDWQQANGRPFQLFTEASINMAEDPELLTAMNAAGFNEVFIGIETPKKESLEEAGKNQNLKVDMLEAVRTIQRYGMEVNAGFILGFDHDTHEIFKDQAAFIQQAGIPKAMVGLLTALPGTRLYQRLQAEGRILNLASGNNTHLMGTNFMTKMDTSQLIAGYQKLLEQLYGRRLKTYFQRCNLLLDTICERADFSRKIGVQEIAVLFKSLIQQSLGPYGLRYIRFVSRNLLKNRHLFPEVVRLALQGHHFYMITRQALK
ncbi:MAG: B12-binding domain-containing radical SAM protein [Desulfobacteraceae bacterium]